MVFRYWGDLHADVQEFAPLVDRRAGGIANGVLVDAVRHAGGASTARNVERRARGSSTRLKARVARRPARHRPRARSRLPLSLRRRHRRERQRDRRHDPSWGPSRSVPGQRIRPRVAGGGLLVAGDPAARATRDPRPLGPGRRRVTTRRRPRRGGLPRAPVRSPERCDGPPRARDRGDSRARLRSRGRRCSGASARECPNAAGPLRELSGVRFAQRRWHDAAALARAALARAPRTSTRSTCSARACSCRTMRRRAAGVEPDRQAAGQPRAHRWRSAYAPSDHRRGRSGFIRTCC